MVELNEHSTELDQRTRILWLGIRRALLLAVSIIEEYLGPECIRPTKRERS